MYTLYRSTRYLHSFALPLPAVVRLDSLQSVFGVLVVNEAEGQRLAGLVPHQLVRLQRADSLEHCREPLIRQRRWQVL